MAVSRQGLWVTRGRLATARLQARTRQYETIALDPTADNSYREPAARATSDFAAGWRAVLDSLPPGHARRALLSQLVSEASATYVDRGQRRQLHPAWAAAPIAESEDCWVGYAGGFEVTWCNDPVYPAVSFLTLTSGDDA